ncbi:MAG TPA: hypothetical protein ENJ16_02000, partial [Planctomycetaceae bacterium]|nr:hypothetical protein [Planctomycetaceae bacterium]
MERGKRVLVSESLLAVDVRGLPNNVSVLVSCLEVGKRLLWQAEASASEALTMRVPSCRDLMIYTEATAGAPRREVRVRVAQQQTRRIVLDYASTLESRFVIINQGTIPGACPVEVRVRERGLQTDAGHRIWSEFDAYHNLSLRMDPGAVVSLSVAGVSLVDASTGADRFFAEHRRTYVVRAAARLCVVRSRKDPEESLVGFS